MQFDATFRSLLWDTAFDGSICIVLQLSMPQKVLIPERYVDSEPEETLSPQEVEERHRKVVLVVVHSWL